jgi:hypothetical protein
MATCIVLEDVTFLRNKKYAANIKTDRDMRRWRRSLRDRIRGESPDRERSRMILSVTRIQYEIHSIPNIFYCNPLISYIKPRSL